MKKIHAQLGFTMIELLIVITILGILAVAVLSAINPIEQINRGRDTGSQSNAEQLLSAIERYNAFQGHYPWQVDADENETDVDQDDSDLTATDYDDYPVAVTDTSPIIDMQNTEEEGVDGTTGEDDDCPILTRLGPSSLGTQLCPGADEVKQSFVSTLSDSSTRTLYVYNRGQQGDSTYVCFIPQSGAFTEDAVERCDNTGTNGIGSGLPADIDGSQSDGANDGTVSAAEFICGDSDDDGVAVEAEVMHCLP